MTSRRVPALPETKRGGDPEADEILDLFLAPRPRIFVISGPSGVGKDEILAAVKACRPGLHFVVTATTRPRRAGEVDGVDYHFVTMTAFAAMIEAGELLEHAVVYGDYKGIPRQQVQAALDSGQDVILRIDVQGAQTIRRLLPAAVFVFLAAESMPELERRLCERKSEPEDRLKMRIATARQEMRRAREFDYVVVNRRDQVDRTVEVLLAILTAERHRVQAVPLGR